MDYQHVFVYMTAIAACMLIWITQNNEKYGSILQKFCVIALLLWLFYQKNHLLEQWSILRNALPFDFSLLKQGDFTQSMQIFMILCAVLLYVLVFQLGIGGIFYLYSVPVLLLEPMLGKNPDLLGICLFAFFHMGICISGNMMLDRKRIQAVFFRKKQLGTAGSSMYLLGGAFLLFLAISYFIATPYMEQLFEIPIAMERRIRQVTTEVFSIEADKGRVNRGNQHTLGTEQLEVVVDEKPEEAVYLKNFTGNQYAESRWEEADDSSFFEELKENGSRDSYGGRYTFENRQYTLVEYIGNNREEAYHLSVKHLSSELTGYYMPYIARYSNMEDEGYSFFAYSRNQFERLFENGEYEDEMAWFQEREQLYGDYVKQNYLEVSKQALPRLTQLCQQHPKGSVDEITDYIFRTLHQRASYTRTPGMIPVGQEIPEYFLFESKEGYCQHFATTAALMYRLYGVPSRYVTGHMAAVSDFKEQEDGTWKAVLDDGDAHAWTEIYIEGKGWMPVDATPSADEPKEQPMETTEEDAEEDSVEYQDEEVVENQAEQNHLLAQMNGIIRFLMGGMIVLAGMVLLWSRRQKRLKLYEGFYGDRLFVQMMEVLHFGGYLKAYKGMEKELEGKFAEIFSDMDLADIREIVELVYRESFGPTHLSLEETKRIYELYQKACRLAYSKLNCWKKIYYKYWKVYL